jgi:hypothetical protein
MLGRTRAAPPAVRRTASGPMRNPVRCDNAARSEERPGDGHAKSRAALGRNLSDATRDATREMRRSALF